MLRVLEAEVDRAFALWYGHNPHVNRIALRRYAQDLSAAQAGTADYALGLVLKRYLLETGIFWRVGLARPVRMWIRCTRWREERRQRKADIEFERLLVTRLTNPNAHEAPPVVEPHKKDTTDLPPRAEPGA